MASHKKSNPDQVTVEIAAPAERVYSIITDVAGMGRLSPECTGGKWLGKPKGPEVGAVFKGKNRRGKVRWTTKNRVVEAEPARVFAFETQQSGTRWRYLLTPQGESTVVTESREAFRPRPLVAKAFSLLLLGGVSGHEEEMREGMRATLDRLKAVAEEPPARSRGRNAMRLRRAKTKAPRRRSARRQR